MNNLCSFTTLPTAPTGLTYASHSGGKVELHWSSPRDDGGSTIVEYRVFKNQELASKVSPAKKTYIDCNLVGNGLSNYYSISATSDGNTWGSWSNITIALPPPSVPGAVGLSIVKTYTTSILLSLNMSCDTGGVEILDYNVLVLDTLDGSTSSVTVACCETAASDLRVNRMYNVSVRARNALGFSEWTTLQTSTTSGIPSLPKLNIEGATTTTMTVSLVSPADNGGGILLGYEIKLEHPQDGQVTSSVIECNADNPCPESFTFISLTRSVTYDVSLRALGEGGYSPWYSTQFETDSGSPGIVFLSYFICM